MYDLPEGMRYSTLEERKRFYTEEFCIEKVSNWFGKRIKGMRFAVIIGRHTKIYPAEYREDSETTIIIDEYKDLDYLSEQIAEFLPESVYYDRNLYDKIGHRIGQELAFDLDPENVACPVHGGLAEKMSLGKGLSFCDIEFDIVRDQASRLYEQLEKDFCQLEVVYSGRGFHIHVLDQEANELSEKERKQIARSIKKKGFAIDEWVTTGEMRLIRLPFSLHGLVSRIVLPLKKNEFEQFNPINDERCIPKFMRR